MLIPSVCLVTAQDTDLLNRLQAIHNRGIDFYNVDGIEITSEIKDIPLNAKSIVKGFKNLKLKEKDLTATEPLLGFPNSYFSKTEEKPAGLHTTTDYYFVESIDKKVIGFTFTTVNKTDNELQREFINLVRNNLIPSNVYNKLQLDSINFAGRKILLGNSCAWMGVNNVQCRFYGQMNWSVHKTQESATQSVNNQYVSISAGNKGKIVSDTTVSVIFEGVETNARRIMYDFTGVTGLLAGMSGGKNLTIYFVAAPVRDHYVSCVMSFWNNDQINAGGLSPLLEQIMKLR
ncbi:hypothetical protein [Gynurincola endophyticus]|uniref:hypothetical protein n=1 Tax=Gynurincola endophyticus TaxID=2479004 RepID=UPI000F8EFD06|nr:hypothetical protein [Gynurincola endophyticus]